MKSINPKNKILKKFSFLTKIIPSGMPMTILRGPLRGYRWIMGASSGYGKGLSVILNLSETEQINTANRTTPKNSICFDIGANVGLYTILFSKYAKKVYAFEPLPRNISFLYRIIELNKIKNAVIIPIAIAGRNFLSFFREGKNPTLGKCDEKGNQPVSIMSLDYFIEKSKINPNLLKIDVEGYEFRVLIGAENFLLKSHPIIFLSTHGTWPKQKCLKFLKEMNYREIKPLNANSVHGATEFLIN